MKAVLTAAALPALALALAACDVEVDGNAEARIENAAESAGAAIENVAEGAGNLAESAAGKVENAADDLGDVDVDVNLRADGNDAAANRH
jgi:hypothetical protein